MATVVTGITNETQAKTTAETLESRRAELATLRGEWDQIDERLAGIYVERALGNKINARDIVDFETRRAEIGRLIAEAEIVCDGLQERLRQWAADERHRRYQAESAELDRIADEAVDAEDAYLEAARQLAETAQTLLGCRAAYMQRADFVRTYRREHGIPTNLREPLIPFLIPERFLRQAGPSPYLDVDRWLTLDTPPSWVLRQKV